MRASRVVILVSIAPAFPIPVAARSVAVAAVISAVTSAPASLMLPLLLLNARVKSVNASSAVISTLPAVLTSVIDTFSVARKLTSPLVAAIVPPD